MNIFKNKTYLLLGVSVCILGGCFMTLFTGRVKAQSSHQPVFITTPTISLTPTGTAVDPVSLVEGATQSVYVHGTVRDSYGNNDIIEVIVHLFNSDLLAGPACGPDPGSNCYQVVLTRGQMLECGGDLGSSLPTTDCIYSAKIDLEYFTNPAEFTASVYATHSDEEFPESDLYLSYTTHISSLLSINIGTAISYGGIVLGGATSTQFLEINNWGNTIADIQVKSEDLVCTSGSIPASRIFFNGTALSNSFTSFSDFNLAKRISAVPTLGEDTTSTVMALGTVTLVSGTCMGMLSAVAINNTP